MGVQIRNSMAAQGIWYPLGDANMKFIRPDRRNIPIRSMAVCWAGKSYLKTIGSGGTGQSFGLDLPFPSAKRDPK
jgi:hypothetical protein